jgi:predicted O-methyltransferase YrrM
MKFLKIISLIIIFSVILISLDFITQTARWRMGGWITHYKHDFELFLKSFKIGPSIGSVKSGQGIFPNSPYVFTTTWFLGHSSDWENHLKEFKGKPNVHALEIGSFEGLSAIWQLENILTDPASTITCIDIFDDKVIEDRFDRNMRATGVTNKVTKLKGSSEKMLRGLNLEQYDYIYIDGCHMPKWVLSDAVLSWDLLKKGGLMIFDDYEYIEGRPPGFRPTKIKFIDNYIDNYLWRKRKGSTHSPKPAIDAFINIFGPYLEVVFKKHQVVVKKL